MLPANFMGLYQPQLGGTTQAPQVPGAPVALNPQFGMTPGLYGATQGATHLLGPQGAGAPPPSDPWKIMQPKLDAYMADWWARQQAQQAAGRTTMAGSEAEMNGSGQAEHDSAGVNGMDAMAGGANLQ